MDRINDILQFWFGNLSDADLPDSNTMTHWWHADSKADRQIKQQFSDDLERAMEGLYDSWLTDAKGRLAFNILLNQFCRQIYRGCPEAYQYDTLTTQNVLGALNSKMDQQLGPIHRAFLYRPLWHTEHIEYHDMAVNLYQELIDESDAKFHDILQVFLQYAKARRDIISRFGRFPHRNPILKRISTDDEKSYLAQEFKRSWKHYAPLPAH